MTKEKVTVQDIADALGVSRTTVSKVLNSAPNMPAKTVAKVLGKARELNYRQFLPIGDERLSEQLRSDKCGGSFALLANFLPEHFHIASTIIASLEQELSKQGCSLSIHMLHAQDMQMLKLPQNLKLEQVDALLGIEIFDNRYAQMLCGLGKPTLFFDTYYNPINEPLEANVLLMESRISTFKMVANILSANHLKHIGFIGDYNHCMSFRERYEGFRQALYEYNIPYEEQFSITTEDGQFQKPGFLPEKLKEMHQLPQLFCCANDLLAWKTISALRSMGLEVPRDILICGFDDTTMLHSLESTLTTVTTPSAEMGVMAARILLDKVANPTLPPIFVYLPSKVQIRQSTSPWKVAGQGE